MIKPLYRPMGLWENYDFLINKYYWLKCGVDKAYDIRIRNLCDINKILEKHNVTNFVFGKTLKGLIQTGDLLDDHDDDFGVFFDSRESVVTQVCNELNQIGFKLIRNNEEMISFERDYRYIDICFFKKKSNNLMGYGNKWFKQEYFASLEQFNWKDTKFYIPNYAVLLLDEMYSKSKTNNYFKKFDRHMFAKVAIKFSKIPKYLVAKLPAVIERLPLNITSLINIFTVSMGVRVKTLSEEEFFDTLVEPVDSFNWKWRARHLNVVTNNGQHRTVRDIVNYFRNEVDLNDVLVQETDTSQPFFNPSNLDMDFWWTGNNYFIYCIKYQFRKGVIAYGSANDYIKSKKIPLIYTSEYYESLSLMTDSEISAFLQKNPIEIENNAVVGGKHRVFAMIGRIISGKPYIPMLAVSTETKAG